MNCPISPNRKNVEFSENSRFLSDKTEISECNTYLVEWSTKEPPSRSLNLAKSTALTNGTAVSSSRWTSTENLYFFFFIMKAISPGHRTLNSIACNVRIVKPTTQTKTKRIYLACLGSPILLHVLTLITNPADHQCI